MPQVFLEYTANISLPEPPPEFLKKLNKLLGDCETFKLESVKSRARKLEEYCCGDGAAGKGFVYLCCMIMPGRSDALKQSAQDLLLTFLSEYITPHNPQLTLHFAVHFVELNEYQVLIHE